MRNLPSGTVTFLFTDIEGSTRLLDELGPAEYASVLAEHRTVVRKASTSHGGVEVDTQGDAFFIAFPDPVGAASAAREAQAALTHGPIKVRMALHTGLPLVTSEGYVGADVHRAARICSTAHGGQVVLSEETRRSLRDNDIQDLGLHRLKDLAEPAKLYQLGGTKFPPLRSLNATNLPAQSAPLIGRGPEVEKLSALLQEARLVTVTGPGGTGKTRVGLQVAAELVEVFKDGVFWVPLAPVTDPDLVLAAVVAELGATVDLPEHIGERHMLLLLDNLEQVLDVAPLLSSLLGACPNLRVLVTSRALLRIEGEVEFALAPLPIADAVALFRQRAAVAEPEAAVVAICERLDCLPLAVELAAARTAIFGPEELLARLSRRLPLLTGGRRDAPSRQQTLRSTVEWSYGLLDQAERRLFQDLAIFSGDFSATGADAVAKADWDTLQSLVEKSLVRTTSRGRLGMLQTIHEFALEELQKAGRFAELRRRQTDFLLELALSANLRADAAGAERRDLVEPELANIRSALERCLEHGDTEIGLKLVVALEHFWIASLPFEGMTWFERLMARAGPIPADLEARVLGAWGGMVFIVGRFEEGTALYERSLALCREIGDEGGVARMLYRLVVPLALKGETARARVMNMEALDTCERLGDRKGVAVSVGNLAHIESLEGRDEVAIPLMRKSAVLAEEAGFIWWKAVTLSQLMERLYLAGRLEEAESLARESIAVSHEIRERQWSVFNLGILARVFAHTGRIQQAGTLWGAIEAEEALAPIGQWESERAEYVADLADFQGSAFDLGRAYGRKLTFDEALGFARQDASPDRSQSPEH